MPACSPRPRRSTRSTRSRRGRRSFPARPSGSSTYSPTAGPSPPTRFLPRLHTATYPPPRHTQIEKLIENVRSGTTSHGDQRRQLDLLQKLNRRHSADRQQDPQLESRLQSFELAYRMQTEAADAFDVT